MNKQAFLVLMNYPQEWLEFAMYPDELFALQMQGYLPGHEDASEHDRNGAFHWWINRQPTRDELIKLVQLTFLDPDPLMAADVRKYMRRVKACDADVCLLITQLEAPFGQGAE